METCDDQVWISAYSHLKTHWCNEKKLEVLGFSNSSLLLFFCTVLMKRISKKCIKLYWRYGTSHILSVFLWAFLSWTNGQQSKKGPIWHVKNYLWHTRPKCQKKRKKLLETIYYFDESHTTFYPTFSIAQLLCEKYWSLVLRTELDSLMNTYIPNIYVTFQLTVLITNLLWIHVHIILISHYYLSYV